MLGYRTKQVKAYGKRKHRIVNVSDDKDDFVDDEKSVALPMSPLREKIDHDFVSRPISRLKPGLIASPVASKKKQIRTKPQPIVVESPKLQSSSKFV
jgi:hypothetical protein